MTNPIRDVAVRYDYDDTGKQGRSGRYQKKTDDVDAVRDNKAR